GWFVVAGVFLLVIAWEIHPRRSGGLGRAIVRACREEAVSIGLALVGIPLFVYAASYIGRLEGMILTWPWASDSWFRAFIDRQFFMIEFHSRAVRARQTPSTLLLPTLFKPLLYAGTLPRSHCPGSCIRKSICMVAGIHCPACGRLAMDSFPKNG